MLTEREEAYRVLLLWQKEGTFIKESGIPPFAMEVALGVCRRHLYLQYFIKSLVKKMPSVEACTILEMGLFQMFFMDVPDYAAIDSCVELAKSANLGEGTVRLTNAVLRSARRAGMPELPSQRVRRVSIENSIPEWLVRRWFDVYGGDRAESIARSTLERPVEWIRVNLQKTSAPVLAEKNGVTGASILYDRFIEIPRDVGVKVLLALPEFSAGMFSFQNPSAYDVVKLLDAKPGMKVWDACAAPGGKTALLAEMDPTLDIHASDSSEFRLEKMQDLISRLGLTNVKLSHIDVLNAADTVVEETFDRILLDVPCSNMGVIARRPESVYRLTPESIAELSKLQYEILERAAEKLKPEGRLVYATCSPDPAETTQVINRFVKAHPEFVKVGDPMLPGSRDARLDGFFAQALERKKS
ncbi:transcription antitermination factor NusB [Fibrobacter sp. UWR2]|uniref:transcription antitermination factor NusB n=1 Tax=Fibrobacter sp. UWR2 TaxID=1964352 RepID=UPI000B525531|nr:transcription antitermination factor NusB [Fibrobacter sp. UWR2]OWV02195.1 RNA methyltransferase [Fibrobacter sp. UWR2]